MGCSAYFPFLLFFLLYTAVSVIELNGKTNVTVIIFKLNIVCLIAARSTSHKISKRSQEGHSSVTAFKVIVTHNN